MKYYVIDYMNDKLYKDFLSLCERCDNYEPYFTVDENPLFVQAGCFFKEKLIGFVCALINPDNNTAEFSGMIDPNFRGLGHFKHLLGVLIDECNEQMPGLTFIFPLSDSDRPVSIAGEVLFTEYLLKLNSPDQALLNNIQSDYDDSDCEYFLNDGCFLMFTEDSDEPVAVLELDFQKTFANIYAVFVDENLRSMGVGTCLLKNFLLRYLSNYDLPLVLNVSSDNPAALKLYKKCGFSTVSRINYHSLIL